MPLLLLCTQLTTRNPLCADPLLLTAARCSRRICCCPFRRTRVGSQAAEQVLKHAVSSPFTALGVERQPQKRVLNTVNKRELLKNYRKLALKLHPDKCEHEMALPGMQALNAAYDKVTKPPPRPGARAGAKRRR